MKLTNSTFARMTKSVLRGGKAYGEHHLMHPSREWYIGVGFFIAIVVVGGLWAVTTYTKYQKVSLYEHSTEAQTEVFKEKLVMAALAEIESRASAYSRIEARLLNTYVPGEEVLLPESSEVATTSATTTQEAISSERVVSETNILPASPQVSEEGELEMGTSTTNE